MKIDASVKLHEHHIHLKL